jgi:hypothetical protein
VGGASSAVLQVSEDFWIRFLFALTTFRPLSGSFVTIVSSMFLLTPVALSLPLIQGFPTHIIVLSAHAWRRTVMAVRKSSTLVPVERIYSMNGVVSVRLHSFPQLVNL